jgi:hypothetical protein
LAAWLGNNNDGKFKNHLRSAFSSHKHSAVSQQVDG